MIEDSPELLDFAAQQNRGMKLLNYLGELVVNGRSVEGASGPPTPRVVLSISQLPVVISPPAFEAGIVQYRATVPVSGRYLYGEFR